MTRQHNQVAWQGTPHLHDGLGLEPLHRHGLHNRLQVQILRAEAGRANRQEHRARLRVHTTNKHTHAHASKVREQSSARAHGRKHAPPEWAECMKSCAGLQTRQGQRPGQEPGQQRERPREPGQGQQGPGPRPQELQGTPW